MSGLGRPLGRGTDPSPRPGAAREHELAAVARWCGSDPGAQWMELGLCREVGGDAWYPEKGDSAAPAKAVCRRCPVRQQCLEWALIHDERFGVWGGLGAAERRALARARGRGSVRRAAGAESGGGSDVEGLGEPDDLAEGA